MRVMLSSRRRVIIVFESSADQCAVEPALDNSGLIEPALSSHIEFQFRGKYCIAYFCIAGVLVLLDLFSLVRETKHTYLSSVSYFSRACFCHWGSCKRHGRRTSSELREGGG